MDDVPDRQAAVKHAREVKRRHEDQLMAKANVVGVGVGFRHKAGVRTDQVAIVVMVEYKIPADGLTGSDLLPIELEGVPVDVVQVGHIRAGG